MLSKSLKWELGYVHYIAKFTISRFVVLRFKVNLFTISWFECIFKNSLFFKDFDTFRWKNFYIRRINNMSFFCSLAPNNFIWFNKLTKTDLSNIPALFATVCFGSPSTSSRSALGDLIHTKDNSCDFYTTIHQRKYHSCSIWQKKVVSSHHQDILTNYLY